MEWLRDGDVPPARETVCLVTDKEGCQGHCKTGTVHELSTSMFCECDDLVLCKLDTEQLNQILSASVADQHMHKEKRDSGT